jgi:hypothetical protein
MAKKKLVLWLVGAIIVSLLWSLISSGAIEGVLITVTVVIALIGAYVSALP